MHRVVPEVPFASSLWRGGEYLDGASLPAYQEERRRAVSHNVVVQPETVPPGDGPPGIKFERVDSTTHRILKDGSNGLPTLVPNHYRAHYLVAALGMMSFDDRAPSKMLFDSYLTDSRKHFGILLRLAAESLGTLEPECRMSVCIPVAARDEADYIGRTLRAYLNQTVSKDKFELVLFLNCLASDGRVHPDAQKTIGVVEAFMREHPELNVRPFFCNLPSNEVWTIGRIRKLLLDAVVERVNARAFGAPHILMASDADTAAVHPQLIEHYLNTFDRRPNIDAIKGRIDWDWRTLAENPLLLFGVRVMMLFDAYQRKTDPTAGTGTPSFAIRAERYADAGGYHPLDTVGEDVDLMKRVEMIRTGSMAHIPIVDGGAKSRLWTSCRRAARALELSDAPPSEQWRVDGARFQNLDPTVRKQAASPARSFEEQLADPRFQDRAERMLTRTKDILASEVAFDEFEDVLKNIGGIEIYSTWESALLMIKNMEHVKRMLRHFAAHARDHWENQLGFEW
jgi:hypothetical protein